MRDISKVQEKRVEKRHKNDGGRKVVNSGATPFQPGDVTTDDILFECKTRATPQKSISLKKEWFDKLKLEAFAKRKSFHVLAFSFGDGKDYYALPAEDFQIIYEIYQEFLQKGV